MSEFDDKDLEMEESVVVMTDEEGNEYYYAEEEVICLGEKRFAILVPLADEDACACCSGDEQEETDAIIAKIEAGEDGEDIYCNPTDEEFEEVLKVYKERGEEDLEN